MQQLIDSEEKLTRSGLADMLGVKAGTISHIFVGRNYPSYDNLCKILVRFPNLNSDWLMLGRGPMLRDTSLTPSGMPRRNAPANSDVSSGDADADTYNPQATADGVSQPSAAGLFAAGQSAGQASHSMPRMPFPDEPSRQTLRESHIPDAAEPSSVLSQSRALSSVERVVVFYADGTFDTYTPKK